MLGRGYTYKIKSFVSTHLRFPRKCTIGIMRLDRVVMANEDLIVDKPKDDSVPNWEWDQEKLPALAAVLDDLAKKFPVEERDRLRDFKELRLRLVSESDRGCALIAAAFLDEAFDTLLRARMVANKQNTDGLLQQGRPLSSFSTKIRVSYAMGFIPEEVFRDVSIIREIRNKFAHLHGPLSFNDESIADQCKSLRLVLPSKADAKSRSRFMHVTSVLYTALSTEARKPRVVAPSAEAIRKILTESDSALDIARVRRNNESLDAEDDSGF